MTPPTDDHPWWIVAADGSGSWVVTEDLTAGMTVLSRADNGSDQYMTISSVAATSREDLTYNFTVADFNTYFVGENRVLVHNCPTGGGRGVDIPSGDLADMSRMNRGEMRQMERNGFDAHQIKDEFGANSRQDLFKDQQGNIFIGNRDGSGEAEWTGRNVSEFLDN